MNLNDKEIIASIWRKLEETETSNMALAMLFNYFKETETSDMALEKALDYLKETQHATGHVSGASGNNQEIIR